MADSYRQFLDVMGAIGAARRDLRHLISVHDYETQKYGMPPIRLGERAAELPKLETMVEACFRLLKYVQHGDFANQRDAGLLWVKAATELHEPADFDQ